VRRSLVVGALAALTAGDAYADALEDLARKLTVSNADGSIVANVSVMADATLYGQDEPAQGLLFSDNDAYFAPRITTFFDLGFGERVLVHAQFDVDRGFDPGEDSGGDARADEYYIEARLTDAGRVTLRVGKFATAFGAWIARHLAWDNPMVTAPLIYEDVLPVTDHAAPPTRAAFANRRNVVDNQPDWVPIVWGPSYTTGASLAASSETLDATIEVKNAALSSRPDTWDAIDGGFDTDPTYTAHVRLHPGAEWWLGVSASRGPYMQDHAKPTLPAGKSVDDYEQTTYGIDVSYEHRRLQLWSELVDVEYDVPNVGNVSGVSGFVEGRYKTTPQTWLAVRWNQSWFDDVPGTGVSWNRDMRRLDLAVGYRYSQHLEAKTQYSWSNQAGRDVDGDRLFAVQFVMSL
jgi:hypothetical protein